MYKKLYENSQFYTAQGKFYVDKRAIPCYNKLLCEIHAVILVFSLKKRPNVQKEVHRIWLSTKP